MIINNILIYIGDVFTSLFFEIQQYYEYDDGTAMCHLPFTKLGTIYLLLMCFVTPVFINGFCHISIAVVLAKSMKMANEMRDKLVLLLHNVCNFKPYYLESLFCQSFHSVLIVAYRPLFNPFIFEHLLEREMRNQLTKHVRK